MPTNTKLSKQDHKPNHPKTKRNINPGANTCHLSGWRKLQILLMSITVAPLRLLMFIVTFLLWWCVSKILELLVDTSKASREQKRRAWYPMSLLCRAMLFCAGFHHIEVQGARAPTARARILALAPHRGYFDVFLFLVIGGDPIGLVVAEEHIKKPGLGLVLKLSDSILVRRDDRDSRLAAVKAVKNVCASKGSDSRQIIMFPEGTCHNYQSLMSFKAGAFIPGAPVQPATVEYLNDWDTISWTTEGPSAAVLFWYTLCQLETRLRITFLPVYEPSDEERNDPLLFAHNVRAVLSTALRLPVTEHSSLDFKLMEHAGRCGLPKSAGCVELLKLRKVFGIDLDQAKECLSSFARIVHMSGDGNGGCEVTVEQLADHVGASPTDPVVRQFFSQCDLNGSGMVGFRAYLVGYLTAYNLSNRPFDHVLLGPEVSVMELNNLFKVLKLRRS